MFRFEVGKKSKFGKKVSEKYIFLINKNNNKK